MLVCASSYPAIYCFLSSRENFMIVVLEHLCVQTNLVVDCAASDMLLHCKLEIAVKCLRVYATTVFREV